MTFLGNGLNISDHENWNKELVVAQTNFDEQQTIKTTLTVRSMSIVSKYEVTLSKDNVIVSEPEILSSAFIRFFINRGIARKKTSIKQYFEQLIRRKETDKDIQSCVALQETTTVHPQENFLLVSTTVATPRAVNSTVSSVQKAPLLFPPQNSGSSSFHMDLSRSDTGLAIMKIIVINVPVLRYPLARALAA